MLDDDVPREVVVVATELDGTVVVLVVGSDPLPVGPMLVGHGTVDGVTGGTVVGGGVVEVVGG